MNARTPVTLRPIPVVPHDGLTDAEVRDLVQVIIEAHVPAAVPKVPAAVSASYRAYDATTRWVIAYEDERRSPGSIPYVRLADLRDRMQDAHQEHADELAIEAVGDVGWGRYLVSGKGGLDLRQDGVLDPLLTIPRGLPVESVLELVRAYDAGFAQGRSDGRASLQADLRVLLGAAEAVF
ncbi:hypothetical protein BV511_15630 [Methylorubrum extorquens]|uniref:hypothetical protein n=1 Tax=Methylorubrum extorquens TaxID=408 RepID=UPI0009729D2C|nr:hypothetical protein [Methylorubrum extorquens]APX86004.1 hypothetical protein BV511_15630 [Methylorubrum extorquens]